jgi:Recombination enhancement, RecA-dependent nuclease
MSKTTLADRDRYAQIKMLGCIACRLNDNGLWCGSPEAHHLVFNGYRKHSGGNQATIPLGKYHHRGEPLMGKTVTWMRQTFGPSLFGESTAFHEQYGSEQSLLILTDELLETHIYS